MEQFSQLLTYIKEIDLRVQLLVAACIACAIAVPIAVNSYKKNKKEGKSIEHLEMKVTIGIGLPIISIPFLLSDKFTSLHKTIVICAMLISIIIYVYIIKKTGKEN